MNIALIAHDAKKKLMQNFCIAYRGILAMSINIWRDILEVNSKSAHKSSITKLTLSFSCVIR